MWIKLFLVGLLIVGTFFFISGVRFITDKEYAEKRKYKSDNYFSEKEAYIYSRYGRGVFCIVFGLIAIIGGIYALFFV